MKISMMKLTDEYLGRVCVFFISVFRKKSGSKKYESSMTGKILFIKFWGIGSIVLTTPTLLKVKSQYAPAEIYFLTLKNNLGICREIKLIDKILTIDISNPFLFISDLIRTILFLRKIKFDIIIDFEFYTYFSSIITGLLNSGLSIGFDNLKNNRNILFSKTILFNDKIHTRDNFLNLAAVENSGMMYPANSGFPELSSGYHHTDNRVEIIINPNASRLAYERKLPDEFFIEIINHITGKVKCEIILTGSEDEQDYVNHIFESLKNKSRVSNLCGKTNVRELISLIKSASCLITNDSGPLHIASALNTPVIAFFGPESPQRYGPLSDKKLVFYNKLECSPCMSISNSKTVNCIYDSPKCMEQFDIREVIKKIDLFLHEIIPATQNRKIQWPADM